MSNYTKITNFTAKDSLVTGNPSKLVKGSEIDAELSAISVAIATKLDTSTAASTYAPLASPTFTGTPTAPTPATSDDSTKVATTEFVNNVAMNASLPGQSIGLLISDGTNASFSKTLTGFALNTVRATVASHATTADIWGAAGNEIDFTGTETVTDFPDAPVAGASRILHCAGARFTNNANISVQGASNYTTSAGDIVTIHAITTSTFRVTIEKANGAPVVNNGATLLSVVTASNSATVDIETTFDSTYESYLIVASSVVVATDGAGINARLKLSGSYVTTATYQSHILYSDSSATTNVEGNETAQTFMNIVRNVGNAADEHATFTIELSNPTGTTLRKALHTRGYSVNASGNTAMAYSVGSNTGTGALTGVRLYASSGNIVSGTFRLYGFAKS